MKKKTYNILGKFPSTYGASRLVFLQHICNGMCFSKCATFEKKEEEEKWPGIIGLTE